MCLSIPASVTRGIRSPVLGCGLPHSGPAVGPASATVDVPCTGCADDPDPQARQPRRRDAAAGGPPRRRRAPLGAHGRPEGAHDPPRRLRADRDRDHVGYHRLFTHRSFQTFAPIRYAFAVLGQMAVEGPVVAWVADHRKHHRFSDAEGDPHSPHAGFGDGLKEALRGLWHAHTGWIFTSAGRAEHGRYAKDLLDDRGLRIISGLFAPTVLASLLVPALVGWLWIGGLYGFVAGLVWGGAVRILLSPPRDLVDQLDLPLLRPPSVPLERRVAERLVAVARLVRRVVAQQPPCVPDERRSTGCGDCRSRPIPAPG